MKANRVRIKKKVERDSGSTRAKPARSGLGLVLAISFIGFGIVNLVHPLELIVFQATCGEPMFFSCSFSNQQLGQFGARVIGFLSVLLGAAISWFSLFWPRK